MVMAHQLCSLATVCPKHGEAAWSIPGLLRRLHRSLVPLAAVPLLLTSLSGSLYGALSARDIEAFWLVDEAAHWQLGLLLGSRSGNKPATPPS